MFLTVEDCLAMCELTEPEVHAIAQHENIPEVVAAALGNKPPKQLHLVV